jgi:hypothetical protein
MGHKTNEDGGRWSVSNANKWEFVWSNMWSMRRRQQTLKEVARPPFFAGGSVFSSSPSSFYEGIVGRHPTKRLEPSSFVHCPEQCSQAAYIIRKIILLLTTSRSHERKRVLVDHNPWSLRSGIGLCPLGSQATTNEQ